MIRIHFDNKEIVEVETTLEDYINTTSKVKDTRYNSLVFNNQVVLNFDKIVYVEEVK